MDALQQASYRVITEKSALALSAFSIGNNMTIPQFRPDKIGTFIKSGFPILILNMKPETMEDLVKIYALQDAIYQQTGIRNSITFTPYITLGYIVGPVGNMQFYQDLLDKLQKRVKQAVQTQGKRIFLRCRG